MKQNDLGFTFADLLAIIFLLFIISLVTVPKILKTINNYQQKSLLNKTNKIIKKVEEINNKEKVIYTYSDKKETSINKLNYKGSKPDNGTIIINKEGNIALTFYDNNYCAEKSYLNKEIVVTKKDKEHCVMPYLDDSGTDKPDLKEGMIPVIFNGTDWVTADISKKWYDYETKEWANAVLITELLRDFYRKSEPGTTIHELDILAYFVWIPRYKYKLFNVNSLSTNVNEIEIEFDSINKPKSNGINNGEWLTHPAFTFGEEELNGLWVGKFETTGTRSKPTIKPNFPALAYQNISSQFTIAKNFNNQKQYGLNTKSNTHMMKNTEWGAVAYLTNSKYGKTSEVWVNPSRDFITGCAGTSASSPLIPDCPNPYTTENGQQASTTGNIYGIYDMSGGTAEYVMGGIYDENNQNIKLGLASFDNIDNANMNNYIDKYQYGTSSNNQTAYDRRILGDATGETRGWNNDGANFIMDEPIWNGYGFYWFIRGGYYNDKETAGIFSFSHQDGAAYNYNGFRVVLPSSNKK
ncbi:MAG: hypothetical protein PHW32_02040 [Bacilli bacterium]|nr:hypothetical protein [Bacilli bacterium]MDD4282246.1 hypothetical protein [Bacilli bacterium]MDD4718626.1 hypothetical protein [Bacilli bacterium]